MLMWLMTGFAAFILILLMLFFLVSKNFNFSVLSSLPFECGFTSYFFSRFSFSLHFYLIGLIFLFLDLELCFLLPFFNEDPSSIILIFYFLTFILVLIAGLMEEWTQSLLDWKF